MRSRPRYAGSSAEDCPAIEVIFARGTNDSAGLGRVGGSFVDSLRGKVGCRSVRGYAVNYPATYDFLEAYVADLPAVVDLDAVRGAGVVLAADPLGGASVDYWGAIAERYKVSGIPTLLVIQNGVEADRIVGAVRKPELTQWLERHMGARAA